MSEVVTQQIANALGAGESGDAYAVVKGPDVGDERSKRVVGSARIYGTFDSTSVQIEVRQVAGSGAWLALGAAKTAEGIVPIDADFAEIRATTTGGTSPDIDVDVATTSQLAA